MPKAYSILPERFEDGRWRAILEGLKAAGYDLEHDQRWRQRGLPSDRRPNSRKDVLVTWTRHKGQIEAICKGFELHGGRVIVAEEAHLRHVPNGPYPENQYFSLCLNDHQGFWRSYGPERWASWNIEIKPWRTDGHKVLVREQRGIGSSESGSPRGWHEEAANALRRHTKRQTEIVTHPKTLKRRGIRVPLPEETFVDGWCAVTWNSHMGTVALLHGIPVIACGPRFFLSPCTDNRLERVDDPPRPGNRQAAFEHFAWSQWAMTEIRSGEAFKRLLG